jgi:hypothetical protein
LHQYSIFVKYYRTKLLAFPDSRYEQIMLFFKYLIGVCSSFSNLSAELVSEKVAADTSSAVINWIDFSRPLFELQLERSFKSRLD